MTPPVLDASVALTWCFEDQATPDTERLFAAVRDHGAIIPPLWFLEVANVLLNAERRGRITDVDARLELMSALPLRIDQAGIGRSWTTTLTLARTHNLTPYDASYLEIALRRRATLFTLDKPLASAAAAIGLPVN